MSLEPRIEAIRKEYGLSQDDFWQIPQNKQWVCKHAALEIVAAKAGITWLEPQIIEARSSELVTSMIVTGKLGDRIEWSTGETNPTNYSVKGKQPAYPWAMSEKRAKDRVILKLSGIHGLVYSDAEMDSTPSPDASVGVSEPIQRLLAYRAKTIINFDAIQKEINTCDTLDKLGNLRELYQQCDAWMPGGWVARLVELIDEREKDLNGSQNATMDSTYAETMRSDPQAKAAMPIGASPEALALMKNTTSIQSELDKLEKDPGYGNTP